MSKPPAVQPSEIAYKMFFISRKSMPPYLLACDVQVWKRFHLFWLSRGVSVRVVRYEDLLARPEGTLTDLVAFMHVRQTAFVVAPSLSLALFFFASELAVFPPVGTHVLSSRSLAAGVPAFLPSPSLCI